MKAGDVFVSVNKEGGVYLLLRRIPRTTSWECLVLAAEVLWQERAGDIVRNTEHWLLNDFKRAEDL